VASHNERLFVIGYGSLLSGYGLVGPRRKAESRLYALDAEPVVLANAKRGLAKWSSHGNYFAMDIEPVERNQPITGHPASNGRKGIGAILLTFDRSEARKIARREEYGADLFEKLLALAERAGLGVGEFLARVADETNHDLLAYRTALRALVGQTSPGYIFHPVPLDDGRVAIIAIGSGFEGSGDPEVISWRRHYGIERVMALGDALAVTKFEIDRAGQFEYIAECLLGGFHGIDVGDLIEPFDLTTEAARELLVRIARAVEGEAALFAAATSLDAIGYRSRFEGAPIESFARLLSLAKLE
jgi:hypothetical protein